MSQKAMLGRVGYVYSLISSSFTSANAAWSGEYLSLCYLGNSQGHSVLIAIAEASLISMCYGYGRCASAGLIAAK